MRSSLAIFVLFSILTCPGLALAQCFAPTPPGIDNCDIYIDTDGDGLAGPNQTVGLNQNLSFYVWIDTKAYTWTNFLAFVTVSPFFSSDTSQGAGQDSMITGGTIFNFDNVSNPMAVGIGGLGFNRTGLQRLGKLSTRAIQNAASFSACLTPIVDPGAAYGTFTSVGTASDYSLFCNGMVTPGCYTIGGNPTDATSWGQVKGLFK